MKRKIMIPLTLGFTIAASVGLAIAVAKSEPNNCKETTALMRDLTARGFTNFAGSKEQVLGEDGRGTGLERYSFFRKDGEILVVEHKGDRPGSLSCVTITAENPVESPLPADKTSMRLPLHTPG